MGDPLDDQDEPRDQFAFLDDLVVDGEVVHGGPNGTGPRPGGLNAFERSVVDRVARERDVEAGRAEFGRYAESHQGGVPARSNGGRDDGGDAVGAIYDAAQRFEPLGDGPSQLERDKIAKIIGEGRERAVADIAPDPSIAQFSATIPDGGVTTNRNNEWVLKLNVAWGDRTEIARVIESIPMQVNVTIERVDG